MHIVDAKSGQVVVQSFSLAHYIPLLLSIAEVTSTTSLRSLSPPIKSPASNVSSDPDKISKARLCEPPIGMTDVDDKRGLWGFCDVSYLISSAKATVRYN